MYLSLFFKTHRQTHYDLMMRVRETGNWEAWLEFFLTGVRETAEQAVNAARRILTLLDSDRQASMLRVFQHAQTNPTTDGKTVSLFPR